ncbi:MAG: C-GCAxxG-C-C family (seleno)protein [Candidatus Ranarchaeia archaeon]
MATKSIEDMAEQAVKDLQGDYHCAEAVFKAVMEYYGSFTEDLRRMANAWGGGIGDTGGICGGASGALMAISYLLAPEKASKESWVSGEAASEFMSEYLKRLKTISCNEIRRGLHWTESDPFCFDALRIGVRTAIDILNKHLKK